MSESSTYLETLIILIHSQNIRAPERRRHLTVKRRDDENGGKRFRPLLV